MQKQRVKGRQRDPRARRAEPGVGAARDPRRERGRFSRPGTGWALAILLLGGTGLLLSLFPAALLHRSPVWLFLYGALAVLLAGRLAVVVYQVSFHRAEPGLV